jgi:hypothetical protein
MNRTLGSLDCPLMYSAPIVGCDKFAIKDFSECSRKTLAKNEKPAMAESSAVAELADLADSYATQRLQSVLQAFTQNNVFSRQRSTASRRPQQGNSGGSLFPLLRSKPARNGDAQAN